MKLKAQDQNEMSPAQLEQFKIAADKLLAQARSHHAVTAAAVAVHALQGLTVNVRLADIDNVSYHNSRNFALTVFCGQKKGSVSGSDLSDDALSSAITKACSIASYGEDDPCNGLADASLMVQKAVDLELCYPSQLTPQQLIKQAIIGEQRGRDYDPRIVNSEGVSLASYHTQRVYGNTHGVLVATEGTRYEASCALIAKSQGSMEQSYRYSVARDAELLLPLPQLAEQTAQRAVARLNPRRLTTRKAPVIFEAGGVAQGLIGILLSAISGRSIYQQSSFLAGQIGQKILPSYVRIDERPLLPKGLASAAFDNEGVATYAKDIITDGILQTYLLGSYSARRLKMNTTANAGGAHNIFVSHGDDDLPKLIKKMDKGLLVTELLGHGVNLLTGDYSLGASGFWIEHGEIQYPVSEITIAANLKEMFAKLIAVGCDVDCNSSIQTGSILLESMSIASA